MKKSTVPQLESRGLTTPEFDSQFSNLSADKLILQLKNISAQERTSAAKLLGRKIEKKAIPFLCEALRSEKKLYTKIAITESLAEMGTDSLQELIKLLGHVGNNQHRKLPEKPFNKKSYPLPRDIAARTIIKIGPRALPFLKDTLKNCTEKQISEAIDATGHISFYSNNRLCLVDLLNCYERFSKNDLIQWKILRSLSAFPCKQVRLLLESVISNSDIDAQVWEAQRSLNFFKDRF